jgi:hypothetical protein
MANSYEGTFRIRYHADKGITLDRGNEQSTLTAADVNKAMEIMVDNATKLKCGFDRWSLYIPGVNETLGKDDKQLPLSKVKAALKEADNVVELHRGKFAKPKMVIGKETIVTKRVSKFQDLA